jgi:5-(carboxyamino)imidazole ribonucleotide mutase
MEKEKTMVSIVMPNEKDMEVMGECAKTLESLGVSNEVKVVSAHRAPAQMIEYAKNARNRGIEVIIATACGAAHLPGMIAAFTTLPVIAVPMKSPLLDGLDSILSMLQMPSGVPVATVSVNGARNAAILAAQIISLHNKDILREIENLKSNLAIEVQKQAENVKSRLSSV